MLAEASGHIEVAFDLLDRIQYAILFPLMSLMTGVAILVFLWGVFQYIYHSDSDDGRETGRRHMIYGVIGLLVMLSAYTILRIAAATFGCDVTDIGCD